MEYKVESNPCELKKFVIPEIISGTDSGRLVGRYLIHFGTKNPMIVTDREIRKLQWFSEIEEDIRNHVESYVVFDQITANPKDTEAMEGARVFRNHHCDLIVAIGGGSALDCAKCISIVSSNGGHILDYEGVDEIHLPGPPLICLPTTAGTSADVSQFAIILDTQEKVKKAIISKMVVPDLALIDPVPLMEMGMYLTACTAMDALTHAIEAYVSSAHSALTDIHALSAIGLIVVHIEEAVSTRRTLETMGYMMQGSMEAGLAFSNASLGAVHAMAHSLGGAYDLPHGECNSILLEHVVEANFEAASLRYCIIAEKMGIPVGELEIFEVKKLLLQKIRTIRERVGISGFLKMDGPMDLDALATSALNDPCMITNPKSFTKEEVKAIYERIIRN